MSVNVFVPTDAATQPVNTYYVNNDGNWSVAQRSVDNFAPHAQSPANLTVALDGGYLFNGTTLTAVAPQSTATLTAPHTNPRNDIVYIDSATASVGVVSGAESSTPVDPALPAGKLPVARISWSVGATSITNAMLSDLRALDFAGLPPQVQNQLYVYSADTGTANAYVAGVFPPPASLQAGQRAVFLATNANSGAGTLNWCNLGAQSIKKIGGSADLAAGDILAGQIVDVEFDGTNWQMTSQTGATPFQDPTTTRGDLIVRGASQITRLPLGSANQVLSSNGTDDVWQGLSALLDNTFSNSQGAILYRGASAWAALPPGTAGQVLQTGGAGANPGWATTGLVPTGTILDYAGTSTPSGFLICDGTAYSRTTYAALFAAISTTWGAGDGSTTFNVPAFQRRVSVGAGGTGTSVLGNAVGNTGGEETHQLTVGEMPSHNHFIDVVVGLNVAVGGGPSAFGGTTGLSTAATGGDSAHNNIQPSAIVLKIIKT